MEKTDGIFEQGSEDQELLEFLAQEDGDALPPADKAGEAAFDADADRLLNEFLTGGVQDAADGDAMPIEGDALEAETEESEAPSPVEWKRGGETMDVEYTNAASAQSEAIVPGDMLIAGNITLRSAIRICGIVDGDIECGSSVVVVGGQIEGNIQCDTLTVEAGSLTGDVTACHKVIVEEGAHLKGNISAASIRSNAQSEGDIKVSGLAIIEEHAQIRGDISASSLSVAPGAKIRGMVDILAPEETEEQTE